MADRESEVIAKIAPGVAGARRRANGIALAGGDPFLSHAFLSALEDSGSVGPGTGWTPAPILVEDDAAHLVAAAPAYLKSHSQGEYVFDHGWADAWERAGGQYYPKLQVAVPFTPVPGPRLLGASAAAAARRDRGGDASRTTCRRRTSPSSTTPARAECERRGWLIRHGIQYHWFNRGYASFDDFLAALTQPQAQGDPQGARGGARRAGVPRAARRARSAPPNGTRCGPSTRTPARANGASPI